jgi:signal transduction histidine kinase
MSGSELISSDLVLPKELVRANPAWRKIYDVVHNGEYIAFLGPRHSGKTLVLQDVLATLQYEGGYLPVYISLENWVIYDHRQFFRKIAEIIRTNLNEAGLITDLPLPEVLEMQDFRSFLHELTRLLPHYTFIIAITHFESIPRYLARALLRSLRIVYNERNTRPNYQRIVTVVVGALNLFDLSSVHNKTSPYNIARPVVMVDADRKEAEEIIHFYSGVLNTSFSQHMVKWIWEWAQGDRYAIQALCRMALEAARWSKMQVKQVTYRAAERVMEHMLLTPQMDSGLWDRLHSVETDPKVLMTLLDMLEGSEIRRRSLLTDADEVELTGFVRFENNRYAFRNRLSEKLIKSYFNPLRSARHLAVLGRWNDAVKNYEKLDFSRRTTTIMEGQDRNEYLTAVVNHIYTLLGEEEIVQKKEEIVFTIIAKALEKGFGLRDFNIYRMDDAGTILEAISRSAANQIHLPERVSVLEGNGKIEARAVIEKEFLLEENQEHVSILAAPIVSTADISLAGNTAVIGLVTIYGHYPVDEFFRDQAEISEIVTFLSRCGQAVFQVRERNKLLRNERKQLELMRSLNGVMKAISSVLDLPKLLEIVARSVQAVLNADQVLLYLDEAELKIARAPIAVATGSKRKATILKALPKVAAALTNIHSDSRQTVSLDSAELQSYPELKKEGILSCAICSLFPDKTSNALLFVNYRSSHQFDELEREVIRTFSDQAAIAIQNASLYAQEDRRGRQLFAISQVATHMRIEDDAQTILRLALTGATDGNGLGFSRAFYFQYKEHEGVLEGQLAIGGLTKEEAERNWKEATVIDLETDLRSARAWPKGPRGELDKAVRGMVIPYNREEGAPVISIMENRSILVKNARTDPLTNALIAGPLNSNAFAAIPFISKEKPIGVLIIDQQYLPYNLSQTDLTVVEMLADLGAIAIENASLIRRLENFGEFAHQMRSPLMDIRGRIQMLEDGVITQPEHIHQYYKVILYVMESFASSINQMINLQKIEAGIFDVKPRLISLLEVIQEVVQSFQYTSEQVGVPIIVNLRHQHDTILADREKLGSAVLALVENAIKYSQEKGAVTVLTEDTNQETCISVTDQGLGINPEDIPHLGERHFRGRIAQEEEIEGIGLGLMIVRHILEGHHGQLVIHSVVGKGSTFKILLPRSGGT